MSLSRVAVADLVSMFQNGELDGAAMAMVEALSEELAMKEERSIRQEEEIKTLTDKTDNLTERLDEQTLYKVEHQIFSFIFGEFGGGDQQETNLMMELRGRIFSTILELVGQNSTRFTKMTHHEFCSWFGEMCENIGLPHTLLQCRKEIDEDNTIIDEYAAAAGFDIEALGEQEFIDLCASHNVGVCNVRREIEVYWGNDTIYQRWFGECGKDLYFVNEEF